MDLLRFKEGITQKKGRRNVFPLYSNFFSLPSSSFGTKNQYFDTSQLLGWFASYSAIQAKPAESINEEDEWLYK